MQSQRMSGHKAKGKKMKWKKERRQAQGASYFFLRFFRQLLTVGLLFVYPLGITAPAQIVSPEVMKVSGRFVCQCGCSEQLSVCAMLNCGSATPLRAEIAELLKQGKTEKEITNIFVTKYGKVILAAPTTQGLDLAAWTMPFVMLLLGLGLIYYLIKLWAGRRVAPAAEGENTAGIPQDYRQRMERELKDLDS